MMRHIIFWIVLVTLFVLNTSEIVKIIIVGTNDFHGNLEPLREYYTFANGTQINYKIGGAEVICNYINILKKEYPNIILLDAGDIYSGTLISDTYLGIPVIMFYNYLGYDAQTFGNHEFDYGTKHLQNILTMSKAPFVTSNIKNKYNSQLINWKNQTPLVIKYVNGITVGIIGVTMTATLQTTIPNITNELYFDNLEQSLIKTAKYAKYVKNAQIIIALIHDYSYNIIKIIKKISSRNLINLVISGHTHEIIKAETIYGIPNLQSSSYGKYIGIAEINYDSSTNKIIDTLLWNPVKICHQFFSSSNNCLPSNKFNNNEIIIPAIFIGHTISSDNIEITTMLEPYRSKIKEKQNKFIAHIPITLVHDKIKNVFNLGKLMAKAIKKITYADIGVVNNGSIRKNLTAGNLIFNDLYNSMPFTNNVMIINITGKQIYELAKIKQSKFSNELSISGLILNSHNSITLTNKKNIVMTNFYKLGTHEFNNLEFLIESFGGISNEMKFTNYSMTQRDAFILYINSIN